MAAERIIKDSGVRIDFASGMVRDTSVGKPRFDLLIPENMPYELLPLTRVADLLSGGAIKYSDRNWEKANSKAELDRMKQSAFRHFVQWIAGEVDEDHMAAVVFNLFAAEYTKWRIAEASKVMSPEPEKSPATEFVGQGVDVSLMVKSKNCDHDRGRCYYGRRSPDAPA